METEKWPKAADSPLCHIRLPTPSFTNENVTYAIQGVFVPLEFSSSFVSLSSAGPWSSRPHTSTTISSFPKYVPSNTLTFYVQLSLPIVIPAIYLDFGHLFLSPCSVQPISIILLRFLIPTLIRSTFNERCRALAQFPLTLIYLNYILRASACAPLGLERICT